MLSLRIKIIYIIGILCTSPIIASAQIEEMIENEIKSYITAKAEDYIDDISGGLYGKAKQFYYNPVGTIWESYIQSDVQRSVNSKAGELKNFKVGEKELLRLRNKFSIGKNMATDQKTMFMPVRYGITEYFSESLIKTNRPLSKLINEDIMNNYVDSLKTRIIYNNLEDVLSQPVMDSVDLFKDIKIKEILIKDINICRGLIGLFNRHPEIVRVYANSINTDLRTNSSHLYYWGVLADSHKQKLSKKTKLIDPRNVKFEKMPEKDVISLKYNNSIIGNYNGMVFGVVSPELLNLMPKPNSLYLYGDTYALIDFLGRLSFARLSVNTNGKKIEKTSVKFKDLAKSLDITNKNDLYTKLLKMLKIQPSAAFLVETGNQLNSSDISRLKKSFKTLRKIKSDPIIDVELSYKLGSSVPSIVKVEEFDSISIAEVVYKKEIPDSCLGIKEMVQRKNIDNIKSQKNVYRGSIDGRYPIVMNFCLLGNDEEGIIFGDYFYSKYGNSKRMTIRGKYNNTTFIFDEFDNTNKKFGNFKGTKSGNKISGKFLKEDKEMPFTMVCN